MDGHDWPADVAPTLNAHFGEKQGLEDQHIRGGAAYSSPAVANPLTARMHKGINTTADEGQTPIITHGGGFDDVAHSLRAEGFDASEDGTGRGTPIVPVAPTLRAGGNETGGTRPYGTDADTCDSLIPVAHPIAIQERAVSENPDAGPDGKGWRDDGAAYTLEARQTQQAVVAFTAKDHGGDAVEGISPTLRAGGHTGSHANAGVMPAVAFDMRGREGGAMPEGPHDTANIRAASGGSSRSYAASAAWGVRRLTPRECERLMGFPDDFTLIPWRGKAAENCPDGVRYKALGNSIAVNVISFIGERIEAVRAAETNGAKDG